MIDFLGLCSYPDTLSLLYNHNSSHRHIGRVICVRISRQIRWCWITASNHTRLPQHQIVSPFYLWIMWSVNYVSEHTDLQMIWWPLCWKDIMIIYDFINIYIFFLVMTVFMMLLKIIWLCRIWTIILFKLNCMLNLFQAFMKGEKSSSHTNTHMFITH